MIANAGGETLVPNVTIVILTFNRSAFLASLLKSLAPSEFAHCEIWILNNASTDDTLDVIAKWRSSFSALTVVSHSLNLGADLNILRAFEYGTGYYKWILCDDDELSDAGLQELATVLCKQDIDLIRVADLLVGARERGRTRTLDELLHDKAFAFLSLAFVPGVVFRSSVVVPFVRSGYAYLHTRYQHLFIYLSAFAPETLVYTTQRPVVIYGTASGGPRIGSAICVYWLAAVKALPTARARRIGVGSIRKLLPGPFGFGRRLLRDRLDGQPLGAVWRIWRAGLSASPTIGCTLMVLANAPSVLLPDGVLRHMYRSWRGVERKRVKRREVGGTRAT